MIFPYEENQCKSQKCFWIFRGMIIIIIITSVAFDLVVSHAWNFGKNAYLTYLTAFVNFNVNIWMQICDNRKRF